MILPCMIEGLASLLGDLLSGYRAESFEACIGNTELIQNLRSLKLNVLGDCAIKKRFAAKF